MPSKSLYEQLAEQWKGRQKQESAQPKRQRVQQAPKNQSLSDQSDPLAEFFSGLRAGSGTDAMNRAVDRLVQSKISPSLGVKDIETLLPTLRRWQKEVRSDPLHAGDNLQRLLAFCGNSTAISMLIDVVSECDARLADDSAEKIHIKKFVSVLCKLSEYREHLQQHRWRLQEQELERARARAQAELDRKRSLLTPISEVVKKIVGNHRKVAFYGSDLSPDDERLCHAWANNKVKSGLQPDACALLDEIGDYQGMRLYSARQAEHAAIEYYRQLGMEVIDVSVHQITGADDRWKTHDIEVNRIPMDVKNSRRSFSSPETYSEHCVANWKQTTRNGTSVRLVGILSEYVTGEAFREGRSATAVVLGEVSSDQLVSAAGWFERWMQDKLQFIAIDKPKYFPGWVFEYPNDHYATDVSGEQVDAAINEALLGGLAPEDVPRSVLVHCASDFSEALGLDPTASSLLASMKAVKNEVGLSRMSAVMLLLALFVRSIHSVTEREFDLEQLRSFFFFQTDDGKVDVYRPFGRLDTEGFVNGMLNALARAMHAARDQMKQFRRFQLAHANILRGDDGSGRWTTLLAYCGGFMPGPPHARCGKSPLVIGEEIVCDLCRHLVCSECGWCTADCPQVKINPLRVKSETETYDGTKTYDWIDDGFSDC